MVMKAGEVAFIDTNILLTATDESRKFHSTARELFSIFVQLGVHLGISGQVVREYLSVATRPISVNGLGMVSSSALQNINEFSKKTQFFVEDKSVLQKLYALIKLHELRGKRIHDANIVATMQAYSVSNLITNNPTDFECFSGITLLTLEYLQKTLSV